MAGSCTDPIKTLDCRSATSIRVSKNENSLQGGSHPKIGYDLGNLPAFTATILCSVVDNNFGARIRTDVSVFHSFNS